MVTVDECTGRDNVVWRQPLKLIVLMGFPDSGKTTCLNGRADQPSLQGLCSILSGETDVPANTNERCREAFCTINGKKVNVYFGLDGDSEGFVYENITNIGQSSTPYDVAIITLQRRLVDANLAAGTVWQKWIDRSIRNYTSENPAKPFPDHERYYVHALVPQIYTAVNDYVGKIGTHVVNPPYQKWDDLTKCTQNHLLSLLALIV